MAAFNLRNVIYSLIGGNPPGPQPPPLSSRGFGPGGGSPRGGVPRRGPLGSWRDLFLLLLAALVLYAGYFWLERRYVVDADEVLVLLRKNASHSLPGDQVVIPDPN